MEKTFTFRFYDIDRSADSIPTMVEMFRTIAAIENVEDREKLLAADYTVRLENFEDDGPDAVVGELVRCQNTNLPSEISEGERKTLSAERLGHSVIFRINHKSGTLGLQYDNRIVSPGKLLVYLSSFNASAIYAISPRIDASAWQKFNSGPSRKLIIKIANPSDLDDLGGNGKSAADGFRSMGEAYDAAYITVELSMGTHKGMLSNAVSGLATMLTNIGAGGARLEKLKARTVVNDEVEEIDLIEDRVVAKDALEIHDRDPEINWKIKRDYLCEQMRGLIG